MTFYHEEVVRLLGQDIEAQRNRVLNVWRDTTDPHLKAVLDALWNRLHECEHLTASALDFYRRVNKNKEH